MVELVDCREDWEFRVISSFELSTNGLFPGGDFIDDEAVKNCPREFEFIFAPTVDSWPLGDRLVTCIIGR